MTRYNTLKVRLSNQKLGKLKSGIKNGTEITLKLSSNVAGDSNVENVFPRKSILTNKQVPRLRNAFANSSSATKKLSKQTFKKQENIQVDVQDHY